MAHGRYGKRRVEERPVGSRGPVDKKPKAKTKPKSVSLKNQIRSIERILRKELPDDVREEQEKKLEGLKKQQEIHTRLAIEKKIFLRDRKIKFFERRKIERRIRRLEKLQRASSGQTQDAEIAQQRLKLEEDLQYVKFFPKKEKYVSLFTGADDPDLVERRNRLREQIKDNLIAAAASGKDLEETGSEDEPVDLSEDDFFLRGSSSDEADADDEWTDKSTREQASSASGKVTSGMSSDEKCQRQKSARALMPPPRPSNNSHPHMRHAESRFGASSSKNSWMQRADSYTSTSSNTSSSRSGSSVNAAGPSNARVDNSSSNLSSNSDAQKPPRKRKRRTKKKKQEA